MTPSTDQADTLRALMQSRVEERPILAIVAVRPGVGKSFLRVNLGRILLSEEHAPILVDVQPSVGGGYRLPTSQVIVVTTHQKKDYELTVRCLEDLAEIRPDIECLLIVNQVTEPNAVPRVYEKLSTVSRRCLKTPLKYLGHCVFDKKIDSMARKGKSLLELNPGVLSGRCLELIAKRLIRERFEKSSEEAGSEQDRFMEEAR